MSTRQQKFYMIRLKGGEWEPRRKYPSLEKAMRIACKMSEVHQRPATVLQTICRVEMKQGKPVWTDAAPEDAGGSRTPSESKGRRQGRVGENEATLPEEGHP